MQAKDRLLLYVYERACAAEQQYEKLCHVKTARIDGEVIGARLPYSAMIFFGHKSDTEIIRQFLNTDAVDEHIDNIFKLSRSLIDLALTLPESRIDSFQCDWARPILKMTRDDPDRTVRILSYLAWAYQRTALKFQWSLQTVDLRRRERAVRRREQMLQ